ncbi:MAG: hypothetical protein JXR97_08650, partial [Planctomycetes bacterium]|nr:hypothetical protein [Planctomycetota bacterium]
MQNSIAGIPGNNLVSTPEGRQTALPGLSYISDNIKSNTNAQPEAQPSKAEADTVEFTVPFAESGKEQMRTANEANSFLRLYQYENIHAAAHRSRAAANGEHIE